MIQFKYLKLILKHQFCVVQTNGFQNFNEQNNLFLVFNK